MYLVLYLIFQIRKNNPPAPKRVWPATLKRISADSARRKKKKGWSTPCPTTRERITARRSPVRLKYAAAASQRVNYRSVRIKILL